VDPNPLSCLVGPRLYGLPFRLAQLAYEDNHRLVSARGETLIFKSRGLSERHCSAQQHDLEHFLLERYTAFTSARAKAGCFRSATTPGR